MSIMPDAYDEVMEGFEDDLAPMSAEDLDTERREGDALPDRFVPKTDDQFEWALLKRHRAMAKAKEIRERRDEELRMLSMRFEKLIATEQATADFFTDMIERGIAVKEPDEKGKKTVRTVAGTVWVQHGEHIEWPADDALVAWCKANAPEAVIVFEKPDKKALKERIHTTGDLPDGVSVEKRETTVIRDA